MITTQMNRRPPGCPLLSTSVGLSLNPSGLIHLVFLIVACPTDSESLGKRYSDWPRIEKQLLREAQDTLWGLQLPIDAGEPEAEKTLKELNARRVEERKNASKPSLAAYRWACKLHETYDRHVSDHLDTAVDKCVEFCRLLATR